MSTPLFEPGAPDVLYLVDLSGYVYRAYHAIAPLSSPSGEPTQAVLGTVNMLERLVRQRRPAMLAVAMDSRARNFRRDLYPGYKSNRPKMPEDLQLQMQRCRQIVDAFAIACFERDGLEADDLIASAVREARQQSLRVVIVSADKDMMQLVGPDVLMWDTMRDRVFGPAEVEARYGVRVDQMRDLLALMGDTSDNVPGVPSIGPKTAKELLNQFESIDGIYARLAEIPRKKLKEVLLEHKLQALLSQRLITLRANEDVGMTLATLRYGGRDVAALRTLYAELGFHKHLAALEQEARPASDSLKKQTAPALGPGRYQTVLQEQELDDILGRAKDAKRLAIGLTLSSNEPMRADILGISLSVEPAVAYYVPLAHRYVGAPPQLALSRVLDRLRSTLLDNSVRKAGHDLKTLMVSLRRNGIDLAGAAFDVMLAGYLIDSQARLDLEALAKTHAGLDLVSYEAVSHKVRGHQLAFDEVTVEEATTFAAGRIDAVRRLWDLLEAKTQESGVQKVFEEIEMPLSRQLVEVELTGVLVDVNRLAELGRQVEQDLARLEKTAQEVAGKAFNVHSPRQLETILFDDLGLKPLKRTKTSRSTDAATLEALAHQHALPQLLLEIRQLAKLKGTYIDALPALVNPRTGRIHTRWAQAVAATGRLSSHDPNLQNIPIRSALGRSIREAFVAPAGCVLMSGDYSQIELRVLAHLSADPVLVDAFRTGQDIHTRTAMEIFEVSEPDVTPELRRRAKAVNFGVIYGQGDSGLAKSLGIKRTEAASFIARYFRRYEGVQRFMTETLQSARAADGVRTLFGRWRPLPEIRSANRAQRLAAERVAMNTPIQGTAADLLKMAMLALRDPVTPGTQMILTVHDELVFEVPEAEVRDASKRVKQQMEGVFPLSVPLTVDVGWGKNWAQAH